MNHQQIETALHIIEERNRRVEADKAWEVSFTRRAIIAFMMYVFATAVFVSIGSDRPFLDAFIPLIGYILSVQSLPFLKKWWLKRRS